MENGKLLFVFTIILASIVSIMGILFGICFFTMGNEIFFPIAGVICIGVFIYELINLIIKLRRGWDYEIKKFLAEHPTITREALIEESKKAERISWYLSIGEVFIFFMDGDLYTKVIFRADIDWAKWIMKTRDTSKGSRTEYYLQIWDKSGKDYMILTRTKKRAEKAVRILVGTN